MLRVSPKLPRPISLFVPFVAIVVASSAGRAQQAETQPVTSRDGMVITTSAPASDVGAAILKKGGNAVDAAVATAFALAVTHPSAGNIGGGGFMVIRLADGSSTTVDYRERAPMRSTQTMYLDSTGKIARKLTATGYLAPGVPGTVRGLALAHSKYGKLAWKDDVMPAVELAETGFRAVRRRWPAHSIASSTPRCRSTRPRSRRTASRAAASGSRAIRSCLRDLGRTLRAIATNGPNAFYTGWIADSIAASMSRNGGLISKRDLAAYQAKMRTPLHGTYRGYDLITMPPPTSGGVTMLEMLNILERFDLAKLGDMSPAALHVEIEAMRRGYLDRARYLGDPDFVKMPVARLTSKTYAKSLAASINPAHASSSVELGHDIVTQVASAEDDETTQFSIVDRAGNAVSNTFTLEGGFGSHVVVDGAGFILNNEMGDFNKKPGETNLTGDIGTPANLIAPGKRMLSSMSPTIVTKNGKLFMVTGSPGGRTIINTVMEVVLGVIDFGLDARQAVDSPRFHHQWLPDTVTFEKNAIPDSVAAQLRAMGHAVKFGRGVQGDGHTIVVRDGVAAGANDHRSPDSKVSVP